VKRARRWPPTTTAENTTLGESTTAELGTDTLHSIAYGLALETYLLIPARLLRHAGMSLEATAFAASGEQLSPIWRGATRAGRSERRSPQCQG
jgi:hypothetical protein